MLLAVIVGVLVVSFLLTTFIAKGGRRKNKRWS